MKKEWQMQQESLDFLAGVFTFIASITALLTGIAGIALLFMTGHASRANTLKTLGLFLGGLLFVYICHRLIRYCQPGRYYGKEFIRLDSFGVHYHIRPYGGGSIAWGDINRAQVKSHWYTENGVLLKLVIWHRDINGVEQATSLELTRLQAGKGPLPLNPAAIYNREYQKIIATSEAQCREATAWNMAADINVCAALHRRGGSLPNGEETLGW